MRSRWLDYGAHRPRPDHLSIKRKEFIEAAHASGVSTWRIITRHIIPNCLGPVVVYVTLDRAGRDPDRELPLLPRHGRAGACIPRWGTLVSEGARSMEIAPGRWSFPAPCMAVTLLALNFIGDGLRDALDPKDR